MRLLGAGGVPLVGAAIVGVAGWWHGGERRYLLPLLSLALFAAAIGRQPLVLFLGFFAAATVLDGIRTRKTVASARTFPVYVLADLLLAVALSLQQIETTAWSLPAPGGWETVPGAIVGAAALMRLGALGLFGGSSRPQEGGLAGSLGWWQGALLAWWAGSTAPLVLIGGGLIVIGLAVFVRGKSDYVGAALSGGAAALIVGVGLPHAALSIALVGIAGFAHVLGERVVSGFVLAALPFSIASSIPNGLFDDPSLLGVIAAPAAPLVVAAAAVLVAKEGGDGGRIMAAGAFLGASVLAWGRAELIWLLGTAAIALSAAVFLIRPQDPVARARPAEPLAIHRPAPVFAGWLLIGLVVAAEVRLIIIGLHTSFL